MELMVAMGVTSILVVMMLQIFERGSSAWQGNDEKLDTFREARAALQVMARDLSSLSQAPGADAVFAVPTGTPAPSGGTPASTSGTSAQNFPILTLDYHKDTKDEDKVNDEVYGLIGTRNRGLGDWCTVGYYCDWDKNKKAFVLRRQFANSDTTFATLQRLSRGTPLGTSRALFDEIFVRPLPPQLSDALATYVFDFHIDVPDPNDPNKMMARPPGFFNRNMPPWIEIRFKALGANAARKLQDKNITREVWSPTTDSAGPIKDLHDRFILPGEQQFYTRVRLTQ
jgi:type II secretory pathway pseudopilin PulG